MVYHCFNKEKKLTMRLLTLSSVTALVFLVTGGMRGMSDALTSVGLLYMIKGLWNIVMNLGLFNLTKFGFIKLWEVISDKNYDGKHSKSGDYADFVHEVKRDGSCIIYLAAALVNIAVAVITI